MQITKIVNNPEDNNFSIINLTAGKLEALKQLLVSAEAKTILQKEVKEKLIDLIKGDNINKIFCADCYKVLSYEEILHNIIIAEKAKTKILNMCFNCWNDYCYHAITGE
jgi:hypothetical protein